MLSFFSVAVAAMVAVVAASNFLVQYPLPVTLLGLDLSQILTYGAFTYPLAFLVTDLTNRRLGAARARLVVGCGFVVAVVVSIWLASPRIAIASGSAFLLAQLLDVSIFDRLRRSSWWKAPLVSSLFGSLLDTAIFFSLAFAPAFAALDTAFGREDGSLGFAVPLLSLGPDVPLYVSLGMGDLIVKLLIAALVLVPYRALRSRDVTGLPA